MCGGCGSGGYWQQYWKLVSHPDNKERLPVQVDRGCYTVYGWNSKTCELVCKKSEHVYVSQIQCRDGALTAYFCDCENGGKRRDFLDCGVLANPGSMSCANLHGLVHDLCIHSQTLKYLIDNRRIEPTYYPLTKTSPDSAPVVQVPCLSRADTVQLSVLEPSAQAVEEDPVLFNRGTVWFCPDMGDSGVFCCQEVRCKGEKYACIHIASLAKQDYLAAMPDAEMRTVLHDQFLREEMHKASRKKSGMRTLSPAEQEVLRFERGEAKKKKIEGSERHNGKKIEDRVEPVVKERYMQDLRSFMPPGWDPASYDEHTVVELRPRCEGHCACGALWKHALEYKEKHKTTKNTKLYLRGVAARVQLFERVCQQCKAVKYYDSTANGIYVYHNSLFAHELLRDYTTLAAHNSILFVGYHAAAEQRYEEVGSKVKLCNRKILAEAILAYQRSLNIDWSKVFECPICSKLPLEQQCIVCDAKCDGNPTRLSQPVDNSVRCCHGCEEECDHPKPARPAHVPCKAADMTYFHECHVVGVDLRRWLKGRRAGGSRAKAAGKKKRKTAPAAAATSGAPQTAAPEALEKALYDHRPNLALVLGNRGAFDDYTTFRGQFPALAALVEDLSSTYPLPCHIKADEIDELKHRVQQMRDNALVNPGESIPFPEWQRLKSGWSRLHGLLAEFKGSFPDDVATLLVDVMCRMVIVTGRHAPRLQTVTGQGDGDQNYDMFPNHPRIRLLPKYTDKVATDKEDGDCTKNKESVALFTPGVFSLLCPHGVCLGFQKMHRYEGPSTLFEILLTRFERPPGIIIYDNACALAKYCLQREPAFFKDVQFIIDSFHQNNHVGCHEGFDFSKQDKEKKVLGGRLTYAELNTQVCEQVHSRMEKLLVSQLHFMTDESYMLSLWNFFRYRNVHQKKNNRHLQNL